MIEDVWAAVDPRPRHELLKEIAELRAKVEWLTRERDLYNRNFTIEWKNHRKALNRAEAAEARLAECHDDGLAWEALSLCKSKLKDAESRARAAASLYAEWWSSATPDERRAICEFVRQFPGLIPYLPQCHQAAVLPSLPTPEGPQSSS